MPTSPANVRPLYAFLSYYDAAATATDNDWGTFGIGPIISEDFYFNSATRLVALSRLRREIRNNPYLAGLVNAFPQAIGTSNLRSRTAAMDFNAKKDRAWRKFTKNATVAGDSLRTVEKILAREMLIAGEMFAAKLAAGRVQLIPAEFCGSPLGPSAGAINGITYAGATPLTYSFGRMTPGGFIGYEASMPVQADQVIHIFDRDRVQMGRGLPWLLPCVKTARDLYEITRSKTKQIKDANMISGAIERPGAAQLLQGLSSQTEADGVTPKIETPDSPADPVDGKPTVIEFRPGTLIALNPGEKLQSLMSHYNASDYKELIMLMLHAISAPIGLPVELWFSGLGDVNYSGFKGLGTQWDNRRREITSFLEERFLDPLHEWWESRAIDVGDLPAKPDAETEGDQIAWAWKRTPVLDDEKNARANQYRLSSGEISLADVWEDKGLYPEEVFAHRRELWIKLQVAAGNLEDGASVDDIKVPEIFLLRGLLPGEQPINPTARGAIPATDTLTDPATEAKGDPGASAGTPGTK